MTREYVRRTPQESLVGSRFGRLVVGSSAGINKHGGRIWNCLCDCGGTNVVPTSILHRGGTLSCGCIQREKAAARCSAMKQDNPVSKTPAYRKALKERLRKNPAYVAQNRISRLFRHSIAKVGAIKESPTLETLGYTADELREHLESRFKPGMTWDNAHLWQIDHITPCSIAVTYADVIDLNQLSNLQPLWAKENNTKKAKLGYVYSEAHD